MDYLVLFTVKKLLKWQTTHLRLLFGSVLGAGFICILVLASPKSKIWWFLIFHLFTSISMVKVAFPIKGVKAIIKGVLSMYLSAFLMGGIWQVFSYYFNAQRKLDELLVGNTAISISFRRFLIMGTASYIVLLSGIKVYGYLKNKMAHIYEVTLLWKEKSIVVKGYYDTGNRLRDGMTGKPVSVIDQSILKDLLDEDTLKTLNRRITYEEEEDMKDTQGKIRYIPYQSVGKEKGLMVVLTMDGLLIQKGEQKVGISNPLIGISPFPISETKEYQLIINSELIDE